MQGGDCRDDFQGAGIMKWYWPAIILTIALGWALWPSHAGAQVTAVRVSSSAGYPLLVDGEEVSRFPAVTQVGSRACILTNPGYLSDTERLAFQGWSHGSTDTCVTFEEPGDYTALYGTEFLLTIDSEVRDYREIKWVPRGVPIPLEVPELVDERPGVRYLFEEWSIGEARFSPQNQLVVNRPLNVEIEWSKEFYLELTGPEGVTLVGQGWHKDKQNVVLKAEATAESPSADQRLQFKLWEVTSNPAVIIPNRQQPLTSIRMDDTHTIEANYDVAFQVKIETPLTVTTDFLAQGKKVQIDTSPTIEENPGKEWLSFKGWEGTDVNTPSGSVVVDGPLNIKALYDREYMVEVEAPYGVTGDGWQVEGTVAAIKVPEKPSAIFFLNRSFTGFDGYPNEGPTLGVPVNGPLSVTATYETSVNWTWILVAIMILAVVGGVYFFSQREYNRRRRRSRW